MVFQGHYGFNFALTIEPRVPMFHLLPTAVVNRAPDTKVQSKLETCFVPLHWLIWRVYVRWLTTQAYLSANLGSQYSSLPRLWRFGGAALHAHPVCLNSLAYLSVDLGWRPI